MSAKVLGNLRGIYLPVVAVVLVDLIVAIATNRLWAIDFYHVVGGVYVATHLPDHATMTLPTVLITLAGLLLLANLWLLSRIPVFNWQSFSRWHDKPFLKRESSRGYWSTFSFSTALEVPY